MPRLDPCEYKAPINLQGIWNRDTRPAWESDYHTDLNIQMCYWPLPAMGLADLMEPFLCWMERLLPQAQYRAADLYGCRGAVYAGNGMSTAFSCVWDAQIFARLQHGDRAFHMLKRFCRFMHLTICL